MGTWGGEEGSGRGFIQEKQPPRRLLPRKPKGGGQEGSPLSGQGRSLRRHGSQEGSQGAVYGRRDPLTSGASPHNEPGKPLSPSVSQGLLSCCGCCCLCPRGRPRTSSPIHSHRASSFIPSCTPRLTHSLVQAATLPFIRSLIHSFSHWFLHSFTDACTQRWTVTDRGSAAGPRRPGGIWEAECRAPGGERGGKGRPGKWQRGGLPHAVFRKRERRPGEGPSASPPSPQRPPRAGHFAGSPGLLGALTTKPGQDSLEFPRIPRGPSLSSWSRPLLPRELKPACSWGPSRQPGETLECPISHSPQETPVLPAVWSRS